MKEELIQYLAKIVDIQESVYGLKGNREDLETFQSLLMLDNLTKKENRAFYGESLADILKDNPNP